ncbi:acyltransferase family protein [Phytomonospora sp. NPDC050363]|uniref:acyltransferase family protein n=1 Tax=Phytomonospora sp. NPDC050363 TaxID=3155642 RepID=UPI0033DE9035
MSSAPTALRSPGAARERVFRPDIEGLRAIAVLLVVAGHAGVPWLAGGYVGVDVFFVISGFLITGLLARELRSTGTVSLKGFYARRAVRLLPAATVVVIATLTASWWWLPGTRMASTAWDALASGVYAINYRLAAAGTQYLNADAPPSPLRHFWSLAVEEQFYLVWPPLLLAIAWGSGRRFRRTAVLGALVAIAVGSLVWSATQTAASATWAYYGIHTRAWELAAGALLALAAPAFARLERPYPAIAGWLGLTLIAFSAVRFDELTPFPGVAALLPVTGAVLVIAAGCADPGRGAGSLLAVGVFQRVGRVSYGYYLWHWPILVIAPTALGLPRSLPLDLALMTAAFGVALASYHLVEQPVRTRRVLTAEPWRGIALGAGLTATGAAVAAMAILVPPPTSGGGAAADPRGTVTNVGGLAAILAGAGGPVPADLTPSLADAAEDRPRTYDDGCHLESEAIAAPGPCVYGDPAGEDTIVLFGDSHAAQWFPALDAIAAERGDRLVAWTKSSCAAAVVELYNPLLKRPYRECDAWRDATLDAIAALKPALVVMASADADETSPIGVGDPDRAWTDGWVEAHRRVAVTGAGVVHIADTPWMDGNVPDCLAVNLDDTLACAGERTSAVKNAARRTSTNTALTAAGATVVDPTPWFCAADGTCPVVAGSLLMYRDGHHMTTEWARLLAPMLRGAVGLGGG